MSFDSFCNSCCESLLLFACISEAYFPLPLNRLFTNRDFSVSCTICHLVFSLATAVRELLANDDGEAISRDLHWYYMQNVYTNQIFQRQPLSINFIIFTANKKKIQQNTYIQSRQNIFYFHCVSLYYLFIM